MGGGEVSVSVCVLDYYSSGGDLGCALPPLAHTSSSPTNTAEYQRFLRIKSLGLKDNPHESLNRSEILGRIMCSLQMNM